MNVINSGLAYATPTPFAAKITRTATGPAPGRISAGVMSRPSAPIITTILPALKIQRSAYVAIATGNGADDSPTSGQLWPRAG